MSSELFAVGVNHKHAPVELRERLAVEGDQYATVLRALKEHVGLREAMLISTCNRVEIYGVAPGREVVRGVLDVLASMRTLDPALLHDHSFSRVDTDAVRHIFRVTSSLESLVVGEPQILGQLKAAVDTCRSLELCGPVLNHAAQRAFSVAKKVRNETGIARHVVSISSVAVDLARQIFGELNGRTAVLVGAGEMGELAARHLVQAGVSELLVANRSVDRAVSLANALGGNPRGLDELPRLLVEADIVITSTGARNYLVERKMMSKALKARKYRPIFLIDIAVPRNIDPKLHTLDNVYVYDVDDLQGIAEQNLESRRREAEAAERLVEGEAARYLSAQEAAQSVTPTIIALRKKVAALRAAEFERAGNTLASLDKRQRRSVERLVDGVLNKLMHDVMHGLKSGDGETLRAARHLFNLEDPDQP